MSLHCGCFKSCKCGNEAGILKQRLNSILYDYGLSEQHVSLDGYELQDKIGKCDICDKISFLYSKTLNNYTCCSRYCFDARKLQDEEKEYRRKFLKEITTLKDRYKGKVNIIFKFEEKIIERRER